MFLTFCLGTLFNLTCKMFTVMQIINAAKSRRCDVDKCSPQTSQYTDPNISGGPANPQNTKTSFGLFRTGFHSSHSRLYFVHLRGSLITSRKIRRQTRLLFGSSGFEQLCTALLRKLHICFRMPVQ